MNMQVSMRLMYHQPIDGSMGQWGRGDIVPPCYCCVICLFVCAPLFGSVTPFICRVGPFFREPIYRVFQKMHPILKFPEGYCEFPGECCP